VKTATLSAQQVYQRPPRVKGPVIVLEADCLFVAAPVRASVALAIAHDVAGWFPAMHRCLIATVAKEAKGLVYPAFTNATLARLFQEMADQRTGAGSVRR
jgi:hypothetical protein